MPKLLITAMLFAYSVFSQEPVDTLSMKKLYETYRIKYDVLESTHGHYVNTPNVRMHYMSWGNKKDLPLVWVHGTFSNAYELYEIADSLAARGYYVIAIEYYGHGMTPVPGKGVSLYHVADDINVLMNSLGIKKAVLGGWSRGGSVCTAFYDAYPGKVLGLVLEDGGSVAWNINHHQAKMDSVERNFNELFLDWKMVSYASEKAMFFDLYPKIMKRKPAVIERWCYTNFSRLKKDSSDNYTPNPQVRQLVCQENTEQMMTMIYRPMAAHTLFGASSSLLHPEIIYRNLLVPMLILDPTGKDDEFDSSEENARLAKNHSPFIVHKIYPNTGHAVKFEHPSEFLNDMTDFRKRIKR